MTAIQFIEVLNEHIDNLIEINALDKHPVESTDYYKGKIDAYMAVKESLNSFKIVL